MVYLSEKEISKQESLTLERFNKLSSNKNFDCNNRPKESLIELVQWAKAQIGEKVGNTKTYECFIHNTINMDGSFMVFCEEIGVKSEAVHTDAITSWQTDYDDEHFISVGIFKITKDDLIFYHCGLFHKGNQNEDEVSFFCLVPKDKLQQYLDLRNGFEKWQNKRDRDSKEVEVIGGESFPYDDVSWDDVILPDDLKQNIITSVEGFLSARETYSKLGVPWKMGIGFWGEAGCHAKGSEILMYDGTTKKVEDISVGEFLMGPDSKPREVLKLVRGQDELFEITPKKSNPFIVNGEHILHLKRSRRLGTAVSFNISVNEYLSLAPLFRTRCKLLKPKVVDFNNKDGLFEPYYLGLWLGDGTSGNTGITVSDSEDITINFLKNIAEKYNLYLTSHKKPDATCTTHNLISDKQGKNQLRNFLKENKILEDKRIPNNYLLGSVNDRLEVLAGLIDSDGYKTKNRGCYEIVQKRKELANDIVFLAMSLGFRATIREVTKSIKSIGFSGQYYRVFISGDVYRIPVRLERKKAEVGHQNKSHLSYGIETIKSIGVGDYYGFVIDEDHLYLDGNFFIHHNCGKTSSLRAIISQYDELKPVTIESGHPNPDELLAAAFDYAEEHSPAVLFLEDFQELVGNTNPRNLLQLLDGVKQRDGILIIVTGNGTDNLAKNLKSRPGRFDKFFEFPLPDLELTKRYLTKFLGDILTQEKLDEISKKTVEKKFTYAYLKEVYFNSVHIAISKKREFPIVEDVDLSLKQVLTGKTSSENNFEKSKRKVTDNN